MALGAIAAGLQIGGSILGGIGARKARKKQERFIKKMMADRAARIKDAKAQFSKSRVGLIEEARASQNAAVAGAMPLIGESLGQTVGANYLRSIYADAGRRFQEISRQTAEGMSQLAMMSPYDIVDPSTIGQSTGAEYAAWGSALSGIGGLLGGMGGFSPSEKMAAGAASPGFTSTGNNLMAAGLKTGGLGGIIGTSIGAGMKAGGMSLSGMANS